MRSKAPAFFVFQFQNFRLFWVAIFLSQIALAMQTVTINWHLYELTNSAISLGLLGLAGFLPILIFSLLGGLLADRIERKKIMILAHLFLTIGALVLTFLTVQKNVSSITLYLVVALSSLVSSFDLPARQALIPSLVPRDFLVHAVSLATLIRQISIIIGPPVAGFMIELYGIGSVYMLSTSLFFLSILPLLPLHVVHQVVKKDVSFTVSSLLEGIRFVKNSPIIFSTMLLDFFATFFASATVLLPIFAKDVLGTGARGLGLLFAAPAIGSVVAGLAFSLIKHIEHQGRLLIFGVVLYGIATLGFGLSNSFYLSFFFLSLTGLGDMISAILRNTIRQLLTPDHLRGRMVSINMIFFTGGPYLGEVEAGFLAALIGAPFSVAIGGVFTIIFTLVVAKVVPSLRRYKGNS